MSEANELLENLTEEEISLYTADPTAEPHIIVGADRFITVPDELKRIAVQFDHDIETVTFDCPRFWDGHDMAQMKIYINYKNGTNKGPYLAKNVTISGDIMHFDWTISRNVTQYKGPVSFLVCVKKTNTDGEEVNHWNSELNEEMYVSEGMECTEEYMSTYPDLINQLLDRQDYVESVCITADEALEAAQVATEARTFIEERTDEARDAYSNALKYRASGPILRLEEVSPVLHHINGVIHGKNILPYPYANDVITQAGVTFTALADGGVSVSGTPTAYASIGLYSGVPLRTSGSVVFSINGDFANVNGAFVMYDKNDTQIFSKEMWKEVSPMVVNLDEYPNAAKWLIFIKRGTNGTEMTGTVYPQIEIGESATDYEPYIDPSTATITRSGKNLINVGDFTVERTIAWGSEHVGNFELPSGTYTATCDFVQQGAVTHVSLSARKYGVAEVTYANVSSNNTSGRMSMTFEIPAGAYGVTLYVYSNCTADVLDTKCIFSNFQIEYGTSDTGYEEYKMIDGCTPNADGSFAISSESPIATLYSDISGMTMDIEYNMDTRAYIDRHAVDVSDEYVSSIVLAYIQANPDKFRGLAGAIGPNGKSAYQYATDAGYTRTEAEFAAKLAEDTKGVKISGSSTSTTVDVTQFDYFVVKLEKYDASTPPVLTSAEQYTLDHIVKAPQSGSITAYASIHTGTGTSIRSYRLVFTPSGSGYSIAASYMSTGEANWSTFGYASIYGFKRSY